MITLNNFHFKNGLLKRGLKILGISFWLLLTSAGGSFAQKQGDQPFKIKFEVSTQEASPGETITVSTRFIIPPDHYLYDDKTSVFFENSADLTLLKSDRPSPVLHRDSFSKKELPVYLQSFEQKTFLQVPQEAGLGKRSLIADIRFQGCSEKFCYRPVTKQFLLPIDIVAVPATYREKKVLLPQQVKEKSFQASSLKKSFWELLHESNPERLLNQGKIVLLALAFVGGILTSLTPCVLPIIPLTLAFIGVRPRKKGNFLKVFYLVLGMVIIYSFLGFMAASLGLRLGFLFQNKFFILWTALLFLVFALMLFDLFPFQLPHWVQKYIHKIGGESPWGNFLAGSTIGLIASPCVGPLIAPLLLIAAREQDRFYGFFLLFNYGMGMGVLFFLIGNLFINVVQRLNNRFWLTFLKKGLGLLMLIPAIYYGLVFFKPYFGSSQNQFWVQDLAQGITLAQKNNKLMVLDFYADWCPPCIELENRTFSNSEVQSRAKDFVMVRLNCTFENKQCQQATKKYQVVGWPTILFLNSQGEPLKGVKRVGGYIDKEKMLSLMEKALSQNSQKVNTPAVSPKTKNKIQIPSL